jgi:hypothetical protein
MTYESQYIALRERMDYLRTTAWFVTDLDQEDILLKGLVEAAMKLQNGGDYSRYLGERVLWEVLGTFLGDETLCLTNFESNTITTVPRKRATST